MTVLLWMTRADIPLGFLTIYGWGSILGIGQYLHDSTIAILAALILFLLPAGNKQNIMNWQWAKKIPWGILILLGGGFALAEAFQVSGLSQWIGESLTYMRELPPLLILVIIITVITFLTELTSNTAISLTMMPILAALASAMGVHPFLMMIPAAMVASCAFMLPVATPPNAIVFGSGQITIPQMAKAGFAMDILGVILITILSYLVIAPYFNI
jgi:sodium-dependent dicarboxylate transporter 2/3/5